MQKSIQTMNNLFGSIKAIIDRLRLVAIALSVLLILLASPLSISIAYGLGLDRTIAIVNNEVITFSDFQVRWKYLQLQNGETQLQVPDEVDQEILETLITERLQVQYAKQLGISVSEQEIAQSLELLATRNELSPAEFLKTLNDEGITRKQFARSLEEQAMIRHLIDAVVNSKIEVSEQEIDYHLETHRDLYVATDVEYELSHLYIETGATAKENARTVRQKLRGGMGFDEAVADFSDGQNIDEGGYIGWRTEQQLPDLFLATLHKTATGKISNIIESDNGFHILKVHAKRGHDTVIKQYQVRHILINPKKRQLTTDEASELAENIYQQLRTGGDFEELARVHSDDVSSAVGGGSLGWMNLQDLVDEIRDEVEKLPLDTPSKPLPSRYGIHIMEVLETRTTDADRALERKKARAAIFFRKSQERYKNWFAILRNNAYIEYITNG